MKKTLLLFILLLAFTRIAFASDGLCFKAEQGGQEVTVLCAGQEVKFFNCSTPTPPNSTILFYPGPKSELTGSSTTIAQGVPYMFQNAGEYYVTLIINRGKKDANGQSVTELFEQKYRVEAAPKPTFTITPCANNVVSVTITDQQYDTYQVDYGDGSQPVDAQKGQTTRHTYRSNGSYTITVTGTYRGAVCSGSATTPVPEPLTYSAPVISNLQVQVQHPATGAMVLTTSNLSSHFTYTLTRRLKGEASFSSVATLAPNITIHTLTGMNTSVASEYRIEALDACGTALGASNIVSNIVLAATADNRFIVIQWQDLGDFKTFELYRNGQLLKTGSLSNPYTDHDVICGKEYCYIMKGITADGKAVTASAEQCATSFSTVKPQAGFLLATYNLDNQVELKLTPPDNENVQETYLHRSVAKAPFEPLTTVINGTTYLDQLNKAIAVCYRAGFKNACSISELSQPACPMLLTGKQNADGPVSLNWSAYEGFPDGVAKYEVEVLDETNEVIATYAAGSTAYTDQNNHSYSSLVRYRIKATSTTGIETFSNWVIVKQEVKFHIPSAFTPNGDGLNDKFEVKGLFSNEYTIRIYNGTGQVVFSSNDRNEGWDGTYKGSPLPAGAYAYEVTVTAAGKINRRTGTVTLLR